jgi:lipoprotein Spr
MSKRILFISFFLLLSCLIYGQKKAAKSNVVLWDSTDYQQSYLEKCYYFSHKFGYTIDTITNEKLFETVCNWLRTPYRWGGRTKFGVDCTDFASIVFDSAYHITISGACDDVYKDVYPISKSKLKEGDLIFFKIWGNGISHVGVYLSRNKFAHASSGGVIVSDLDEPYYKKYFFAAGRHKCLM